MKRPLIYVLLALLAIAGCEEDEATPVAAEDFCASFSLAACEGYQSCCLDMLSGGDGDGIAVGGPISFNDCLREQDAYCSTVLITREDLGQPSLAGELRVILEYDAQAAGNVLAGIRGSASACAMPDGVGFSDIHVRGGEGEPCLQDVQCARPFVCANASVTQVGTCVDAPVEGQACDGRCGGGLTCLARMCVTPRLEGQTCAFSEDCAKGLFCFYETSFATGAADGICADLQANGQACEFDEECASDYCAGGVVCADEEEDETLIWCDIGDISAIDLVQSTD